MGECAQLVEAGHFGAAGKLLDDLVTDAEVASLSTDDERSYLADRAAERRQLRACEHLVVLNCDDKAVCVNGDLSQLSRQQMSLREVFHDQRVNSLGFRD